MADRMLGVVLALLTWPVATPTLGQAPVPDFLTELNKAREAVLDEPTKSYYEGPFNAAFYARFSGWLNLCTQQTGQSLADLDLVVTLDVKGRVTALRTQPESAPSGCFSDQVKKEQFPTPPAAPLTLPLSVRMSK